MASKAKSANSAGKSKTMAVEAKPGESNEAILADLVMSGVVPNITATVDFSKGYFGELSLTDMVNTLAGKVKAIQGGDLRQAEAMLAAQAVALNSMFAELARRAALNMGQHMNATEAYIKLALKAQSQCRQTLETLAEIKNPRPPAFVKQANIANGPQQVNNGAPAEASRAGARTGEIENPPNELLEHTHDPRLEFGTAATTSGSDPALEAVGAVHRPRTGN